MDNKILRYNLLLHLLYNNEITSVTAFPLFNAISRLCNQGESHASGAILREYIKQWPKERMTRESFFETLEDIEFNCTLQEVLLELLNKRDLYQGDLFNILKSVKKLETDVTKTAVLLKAKARISNSDSEAKYIFNNVTEGLELEYEFNKVVDR
jgi:HD superfamily phosphohydrolase